VALRDLASGRAILETTDQMHIAVIRTALDHFPQTGHGYGYRATHILLSQLIRRNLPYTTDDIQAILRAVSTSRHVSDPAIVEIRIVGGKGQIHWSDPDGRSRKDAPTEVKRAHKAELKDLARGRPEPGLCRPGDDLGRTG
jgi:hypothetical protein